MEWNPSLIVELELEEAHERLCELLVRLFDLWLAEEQDC